MKYIQNICRSIWMLTLCASLIMGSQIMNQIHIGNRACRELGYWATTTHSQTSSFEMIVPKTGAIVTFERYETEERLSDTLMEYINNNRSRDISFALIAAVLSLCLTNCIS